MPDRLQPQPLPIPLPWVYALLGALVVGLFMSLAITIYLQEPFFYDLFHSLALEGHDDQRGSATAAATAMLIAAIGGRAIGYSVQKLAMIFLLLGGIFMGARMTASYVGAQSEYQQQFKEALLTRKDALARATEALGFASVWADLKEAQALKAKGRENKYPPWRREGQAGIDAAYVRLGMLNQQLTAQKTEIALEHPLPAAPGLISTLSDSLFLGALDALLAELVLVIGCAWFAACLAILSLLQMSRSHQAQLAIVPTDRAEVVEIEEVPELHPLLKDIELERLGVICPEALEGLNTQQGTWYGYPLTTAKERKGFDQEGAPYRCLWPALDRGALGLEPGQSLYIGSKAAHRAIGIRSNVAVVLKLKQDPEPLN